jgi:hypothetical protein
MADEWWFEGAGETVGSVEAARDKLNELKARIPTGSIREPVIDMVGGDMGRGCAHRAISNAPGFSSLIVMEFRCWRAARIAETFVTKHEEDSYDGCDPYTVDGQRVFPVYAASGGLMPGVVVYFLVRSP